MKANRPCAAALGAALALLAPALAPGQDISPDAAALLNARQQAAGGASAGTGTGIGGGVALPASAGQRVDVLRSTDPQPRQAGERGQQPGGGQRTPPRPPSPPTDFQKFAATSVGSTLPVFGQSLFIEPPSTFAPVDDAAPASDYLVGPGDEILVRGWGQVEIDVRAVVSREGTIAIPRVGVIPVAGTRYQELSTALRAAVGRNYRNFELAVSLGRLRSLQVFVVGHVVQPGLYTVGGLSTLMNALIASGGPAPTGTMRRIELRRAEKTVGTFDLYDLLLRGDKSKDLRLQSGDVIFVPPLGSVVAIAGKVKTPAVYELAAPGTPLSTLLSDAGGPTTTTDLHSIQLERLDPDRGRVVQELAWSPAALATPLRDGDVVQLRALSQRFDNAVTLRGNVAFPIRTEWRPGLTISGLIPDRRVLVPESYWERAAARAHQPTREQQREREREREQELEREREREADRELDRELGRRRDAREPDGRAGTAPGTLGATPMAPAASAPRFVDRSTTHIKTDVENLLDEVNWEYAVVERLDRDQLEPQLLPFNLRKAVVDRDPAHDLPLQPGDIVTIFSQKDVLAPSDKRTYFVRIEGEVNSPGIYQVRPGETLRRLVERAGGLARNAYLFGAEFTRESTRKDQQSRLEEVARRAERELEHSGVERLTRAISAEEAAATRVQIDSQRAAIQRMRFLKASGRMVLELDPAAGKVEDLPDIVLENGDRLYVPYRYATVGVFGAVYNETSFIHKPGKSLDEYLSQAGGPTRAADESSVYVLRADGSVVSKRQAGWLGRFGSRELMPNDAIVVPEDFAPISWVRELRDWSQIFYQFGLGVAAIKILVP
ncbi:MAG: SLBB domain-containing protein [Deltaproteobacteria bacterium]|nr:SLBB domain-containing protein [Deltaproteobacteria bacterium]